MTPGPIASNPSSVAVAATAFVANASALFGLVLEWAPGVIAAVTITATSAVGLASALIANGKSFSKVGLDAYAAAVKKA